jgi:maleylpyruvate isomerase
VDQDPASLLRLIEDGDTCLLATAATLGDTGIREPSRLPGWSRGHVLTHIARNADGLRNLLVWARTAVPTPQYASAGDRDAQIEAGAGRRAAEHLADLRESAAAFRAEAATLTGGDWQAMVRGMRGPEHPAWFTLVRRLMEVHVHHVDVGAGYGPADWPAPFVAIALPRVAGDFALGKRVPACRIELTGAADLPLDTAGAVSGSAFDIGIGPAATALPRPGSPPAGPVVSGTAHEVLAWLLGRACGAGLAVEPAGGLPRLPAWPPPT